jgi:heat shock protein HslJ
MNLPVRYLVPLVLASLASSITCDVEPTDRTPPAAKSGSGATPGSPEAPPPGSNAESEALRAQAADAARPLEGPLWVLESMGDPDDPQPAVERTEVTARFNASSVTGNAGCNGYSARYEAEEENLKIGQPIATRKFCNAAGVMEQEAAFLAALSAAMVYRVQAGRLTITSDTKQTLNFRQQKSTNQ